MYFKRIEVQRIEFKPSVNPVSTDNKQTPVIYYIIPSRVRCDNTHIVTLRE